MTSPSMPIATFTKIGVVSVAGKEKAIWGLQVSIDAKPIAGMTVNAVNRFGASQTKTLGAQVIDQERVNLLTGAISLVFQIA